MRDFFVGCRANEGQGPSAEGRVDALRRWGKNTVPRVILSKAKDLLQRGSFKILHFVQNDKNNRRSDCMRTRLAVSLRSYPDTGS